MNEKGGGNQPGRVAFLHFLSLSFSLFSFFSLFLSWVFFYLGFSISILDELGRVYRWGPRDEGTWGGCHG